ncbi:MULTISPECIES: hypothetical protein [unclassified Streptomyces]|uniref:hypothetical protein n=1 Tax=unclassified Streptomyces TaxID=2593676 RepID=UPI002257C640|nr:MULTISPECIES: hypothetical protein [unclassified Streptomyces]MCX5054037.1 hypothetical protein [Streptomyces sp. NBC_00474]
MQNTDPYRLTSADSKPTTPALTRGDVLRTLLWSVVVMSAVANMAASYGEAATWVHLVCGAVTVLCAGTLVVRNLRGRR